MNSAWHTPDWCNVAGALAEQARRQPEVAAVHFPSGVKGGQVQYQSASYRELDELSDAWARGLREFGIDPGARVALMIPPGRDFVAMFFALFKAGVVPVLIDPGIGLSALKHCLGEAAPEAFIGVARAQLARIILGWSRGSIRKTVTLGPRLGWGGINARRLAAMGQRSSGTMLERTRPDDMAAILFTSGSTGIPKGVVYRHRHFAHQVEMLRSAFGIEAGEVDLATFPPFALFDPALGMTTVIPRMDPTRPARARPEFLMQAIERFRVTNVFGSPALINVLSQHTQAHGLRLPTVKRVLSSGAAMPVRTLRRMQAALADDAAVHTPYGATECLPVASISSQELDSETEARTAAGAGICVGRVIPPNRVAILSLSDQPVERMEDAVLQPAGQPGEITVHGPTATDAYWRRDEQTRLAKCRDDKGRVWHRMGDVGYLDTDGRLWYCGRKSQRVETPAGVLFPDQVEAIFNTHPEVARTALVGVSMDGVREPVLVVELMGGMRQFTATERAQVSRELLALAAGHAHLNSLCRVLIHPSFPVDIRHNAKIDRERLARWAEGQRA